jgi:C4-dicarboxylate transporter DctM subunit
MEKAAQAMLTVSTDPFWVLMMINLLLLIAGSLMDGVSIFFIFTPILIPVIKFFNWDFMWFGVVMALNLSIGTITPPVALNLYVAANLANIPMERISRSIIPFFFALIVALLITTYVPWLSLWLPTVLGFH